MNASLRAPRMQPGAVPSRRLGLLGLLVAGAMLGGCTSLSPDAGFSRVEQIAKEQLGKEVRWARSEADLDPIEQRVGELLAKPLSVDDAVQIALLNNRGLQAVFQELGITEADFVQAGRLPNPGFGFARLDRGGQIEIDRGLSFNLARLLAIPLVRQVEARRFQQTQALVAMNVLVLAADTRKAYFNALAAVETTRYMQQIQQAAAASAELARRMEQAGNFNKLARAREQAFQADAALNLARAELARRSTRERLTRLLGLWGPKAQFALPERLPDLPKETRDLPDVERIAIGQRLDVLAAKLTAEQTAKNLGLTRTTRFINVLDLGLARNSYSEPPPRERGVAISFELPLFDWGDVRIARAEAIYMETVHRAADTAITARSEVREAYNDYRLAWDIARHHRDEIVPVRKLIAEENLLRYNGMLIGVFELLADARAQILSVNNYIESLRDFWVAQSDLDMALIGKPSLATPEGPAIAVEPGGAAH